nr:hypothetical protein [Tanacetum cinerariifolium]
MNVTLLAKVEFEVELQEDHTFEVESQRNVGHVAGSQEVKAQDLIHYHLACEREQHSAWELFRYKKDNNDAPFAISKVEKIYAYELLTFDDTVSCEDEIWVTKGLLGEAHGNILGMDIIKDMSDDELSEKELKQIEANVQAIQTILLGLPEDIYVAVDTCETAQEIWLRVQQMMKGSDIRIQEKKAKLFNEWERFTSNERESIESYYHRFLKLMNDLKRNKHFPEKIASNMKFLNNLQPEWSRHKEVDELKAERLAKTQDPLALMANSNNPYAFPAPHQDQPSQMQMVGGNGGNQFRQYAGQNVGNPVRYNDVIGNQIRNGNLEAARAEGNAAGQNGNQIRCYNCRGEEARIQLQAEEYDLMAAAADLDEIEEVNANYILMANLQQASTS